MKGECADEFQRIKSGFDENLALAKAEGNPYLSAKQKMAFELFKVSPAIYLKVF